MNLRQMSDRDRKTVLGPPPPRVVRLRDISMYRIDAGSHKLAMPDSVNRQRKGGRSPTRGDDEAGPAKL